MRSIPRALLGYAENVPVVVGFVPKYHDSLEVVNGEDLKLMASIPARTLPHLEAPHMREVDVARLFQGQPELLTGQPGLSRQN
jgi:hypothetical protein